MWMMKVNNLITWKFVCVCVLLFLLMGQLDFDSIIQIVGEICSYNVNLQIGVVVPGNSHHFLILLG